MEFFHNGKILQQVNHTNINLIAKNPNASQVGNYRPIPCCNVLYELISKVLANRRHKVLPYVIADTQNTFIKGRYMVDNFLLVQELFMGYERKNISPRCMAKIDLRKPYDILEWSFVVDILMHLQFPPRFIAWIADV